MAIKSWAKMTTEKVEKLLKKHFRDLKKACYARPVKPGWACVLPRNHEGLHRDMYGNEFRQTQEGEG